MRVGVLASGAGTNLQALLDTVHGRGVEIVAVGGDRADAGALGRARDAGIATGVFPASEHPDRVTRDGALADWLADEHGVQLVVLAGYMQLLSGPFLRRFEDRVVNVHPALLPAFPGIRPVEDAIAYGVTVFGVTVHLVDDGIDTGPVLLQAALELPGAVDPDAVHDALRPLEHRLLPEAVRLLAAGRVSRDPANPRRLRIT